MSFTVDGNFITMIVGFLGIIGSMVVFGASTSGRLGRLEGIVERLGIDMTEVKDRLHRLETSAVAI
jgi:hypothetical protein